MVIIGKVSAINTSDSVLNLGVYDKDKNGINYNHINSPF